MPLFSRKLELKTSSIYLCNVNCHILYGIVSYLNALQESISFNSEISLKYFNLKFNSVTCLGIKIIKSIESIKSINSIKSIKSTDNYDKFIKSIDNYDNL